MAEANYNSYIICTSPRSGSTLLCKLLAATKKSGNPGSHFHDPSISSWLKTFQLSRDQFVSDQDALRAIFGAAHMHGSGNTKFFGLRLQGGSFHYFMQQLSILHPKLNSDTERIKAAFGHTLFIYLSRSNKLNQAISHIKAIQTGLWHMAADGTELERLSAPQEPVYDADRIARHLAELTALDEAWKGWFDQEKLQPLKINYAELSNDPAEVLATILGQLGLDRKIARNINPPVAKLGDATNQIWAERFLTERDDCQSS